MTTVLITGASSGIGLETARRLAASGYTVIGTSRRARTDLPFTVLELDVNHDASARACVAQALAITGGIDVLINNAGYDLYATAEETGPAELREQMETNFFGAVRMTQLLVPHMRERGSGRIVQLSSVGGLFALPYNSAYAASKFALEGYSEALRHELMPFGVFVSLIEPAGVRTESLETSVRVGAAPHPAYGQAARVAADALRSDSRHGGLPTASVADAVLRTVRHARPGLRVPVGGIARWLPFLRLAAPGAFEAMIQRRFLRHPAPHAAVAAQPSNGR